MNKIHPHILKNLQKVKILDKRNIFWN